MSYWSMLNIDFCASHSEFLLILKLSGHEKCTVVGRNLNVNIRFLAWLFNQILISSYFSGLQTYICNHQYSVDITNLVNMFHTVSETTTKLCILYNLKSDVESARAPKVYQALNQEISPVANYYFSCLPVKSYFQLKKKQLSVHSRPSVQYLNIKPSVYYIIVCIFPMSITTLFTYLCPFLFTLSLIRF